MGHHIFSTRELKKLKVENMTDKTVRILIQPLTLHNIGNQSSWIFCDTQTRFIFKKISEGQACVLVVSLFTKEKI